jgi:predicted nuclease with RNAse H fold
VPAPLITVGVDLAAEPKNTAVARIEWGPRGATVTEVAVDQSNEHIVVVCGGAAKVGIDSPLGWPLEFIDFVIAQRDGLALPSTDLAGRRQLAFRETDRGVTALTGLRPLSVASDRIGLPAMRAVTLLRLLDPVGLDRTGRGLVAETYPAAALHEWGFAHVGYKGPHKQATRVEILDSLVATPGLSVAAAIAELCRASDHALDAVLCALIAKAVIEEQIHWPATALQEERAKTEGWIAVPTCSLADLISVRGR